MSLGVVCIPGGVSPMLVVWKLSLESPGNVHIHAGCWSGDLSRPDSQRMLALNHCLLSFLGCGLAPETTCFLALALNLENCGSAQPRPQDSKPEEFAGTFWFSQTPGRNPVLTASLALLFQSSSLNVGMMEKPKSLISIKILLWKLEKNLFLLGGKGNSVVETWSFCKSMYL